MTCRIINGDGVIKLTSDRIEAGKPVSINTFTLSDTMTDDATLADRLKPDAVAHLSRIARQVADADRDEFFKIAADCLRPIREITPADVNHAACFALGKVGRADS